MPFQLDPRYKTFRLIGLDPGLNSYGVAAFEVDAENLQILNIEAQTFHSWKLPDFTGYDENRIPEHQLKRYRLARELSQVFELIQPCIVVYETPFFDRTKPLAFQRLVEIMTMTVDTVTQYNPNTQFEKKSPQTVKESLGVAGIKGKEVVRDAMELHPEIMSHFPEGLSNLDQHAIDAVAVGWTHISHLRKERSP